MALYIPHSIFHLALLMYVRPETFGPYYVHTYAYTYGYMYAYTHIKCTGTNFRCARPVKMSYESLPSVFTLSHVPKSDVFDKGTIVVHFTNSHINTDVTLSPASFLEKNLLSIVRSRVRKFPA